MMYFKLSIRNARRTFTNYLLYVLTMTILLAIMEISNCIAIMGELADFQTISLPLLITIIQIALAGYIHAFMLKQRTKEFANYLLLGMKKKKLTNLFLCEIMLIGFFCFLAGMTIGVAFYIFFCFGIPLHEMGYYGFLYCKSMFYTLCSFCIVEIVCAFHLKQRLGKLQIREMMYEKNRNQSMKRKADYKKWGLIFLSSFVCLVGFVGGIVFGPEDYLVYLIFVIAMPLLISVFAFYKWIFGYLYAHRKMKPAAIYRKNRLYLIADITSNFKTAAIVNAVFCMCFLFSASSFITGRLMLHQEFQIFEENTQQWMGAAQINICIVFTVIYFSILALWQMIDLRQDAKHIQILRCLGKSNRQIGNLLKQQIAIKLTFPMLMAFLVFLFCLPLLNRKMNLILPVAIHNVFFKFAGEFFLCTLFFYICYFLVIYIMGKECMKAKEGKYNT